MHSIDETSSDVFGQPHRELDLNPAADRGVGVKVILRMVQ